MPDHPFSQKKSPVPVYAAIIAMSSIVFMIDFFTQLGVAEWVFYMIPVVICTLQSRPLLPYGVALLTTALSLAGFSLSSEGIPPEVAIINRTFGVMSTFCAAFLVHRVIVARLHTHRLLWLEQGRAEVSRSLLGEQETWQIGDNMLHVLTAYVGAQVGLLYRIDGKMLVPSGSFAADPLPKQETAIPVGQGLAGEVARSGQITVLHELPAGYLRISSATGDSAPRCAIIAPVTADGKVMGVLELGFIGGDVKLDDVTDLLKMVMEKVGIALRSALYRQNLRELLQQTQRQSEELQAQQEELRVTNEELQEQGRALQESQSLLEMQQNELEQSNVQLEERAQLLERQKRDLLRAQQELEANTAELERANRYKSEFLANMSHELRTPLNSSLILSHMLAENKQGTLTPDQVRYARTIHAANNDLLTLINDILDLSKIEAGQVDMQPEPFAVAALSEALRGTFEPMAGQKGLAWRIETGADVPASITTDRQRLEQIVKNLLSNAFKFTARGEVVLQIAAAPGERIRFAVRDTGIGIPQHQQEVIFEAFRQADGSTSRTYGGTGLGLSISRQLAQLLGGDIQVQSAPGNGSTFTLEVPQQLTAAAVVAKKPNAVQAAPKDAPAAPSAAPAVPAPIEDDRARRKHERMILIVEDDEKFASVLCELVHEMHFDCVHAPTASEAIRLAQEHRPDAVLLDIALPDQSGLSVLERLKRLPATRHMPVHMISVNDYQQTALELGAVGYALKPVARDEIIEAVKKLESRLERHVNRLLIVEDNDALRDSLVQMLGAEGTEITSAATAAEALQHLSRATFDCMVMDLMLPDASGYDILEKMASGGKYSFPPVIVYTGRTLTRDEEQRLRRYSRSIIIKGARSPERLLDEVSLFLHRVEASLPPEQQQMLLRARQRDASFEGRRILVAEDDVRNIFALTSVFEPLGAELVIARNGREALERLGERQDIDLVLMDLMMPEMDGLTAMREIRRQPRYKDLPIIALTAKAMQNDRQECLDAGANDYIAKPIDVDQLVSLCRVWMPK